MNCRYVFVTASVFFFVFIIYSSSFAMEYTLPVAASQDVIDSCREYMERIDNDMSRIDTTEVRGLSRVAVETLMIAKALHVGGLVFSFDFIPVPNARRETMEVAKGNAVLASQQFNTGTLEVPNHEDALLLSSAILRSGEFAKGIYCLPEDAEMLSVRTADELRRKGVCIMEQHWNNDKQALEMIGIDTFVLAPTFKSMFEMLKAGRGNWLPLNFSSNDDLSVTAFGLRLVPVRGIMFTLPESRHFIVSRNHPLGSTVYSALEKGLKELRAQGYIRKALVSAGLLNGQTQNWKVLNPLPSDPAN